MVSPRKYNIIIGLLISLQGLIAAEKYSVHYDSPTPYSPARSSLVHPAYYNHSSYSLSYADSTYRAPFLPLHPSLKIPSQKVQLKESRKNRLEKVLSSKIVLEGESLNWDTSLTTIDPNTRITTTTPLKELLRQYGIIGSYTGLTYDRDSKKQIRICGYIGSIHPDIKDVKYYFITLKTVYSHVVDAQDPRFISHKGHRLAAYITDYLRDLDQKFPVLTDPQRLSDLQTWSKRLELNGFIPFEP